MAKKRIIIISHALELGGAERSLIGLLEAMDPEQYEVDLFLLRHQGELLKDIPDKIRLLPESAPYTVLARPMADVLREGHVLLAAARLTGKLAAGYYNRKHGYFDSAVSLEYSHKYTCSFMPLINPDREYDLAISYLTPHYFTARKVRAKKKIAWIHTDYTGIQINIESELKMWSCYDHIISISERVTEGFCHVFPSLRNRIVQVENILPERQIRRQSEAADVSSEMNTTGLKLLSIGRYSRAKNFDTVPRICRRILDRNLDITWYLIGYGGEEDRIRRKIAESGMEERVILLGKKENPYPYIQNCDWYIQPSRYEGKSVSVREAQILGKPVIITAYPTSASQIEDGRTGYIVPLEAEACAAEMAALLQDAGNAAKVAATCKERDFSGSSEIQKIYQLI